MSKAARPNSKAYLKSNGLSRALHKADTNKKIRANSKSPSLKMVNAEGFELTGFSLSNFAYFLASSGRL